SGGIQEETTYLSVPCITLRSNTERPATVHEGTNVLVGSDPEKIDPAWRRVLSEPIARHSAPELWDGKAAKRIVDVLERAVPTASRN
ncbi:MAG TPA: UDP-N-acetylglucosamine 2-epimerase, partial [Tepidisphaeraceae bacterium]|nr:UDP-N-acetylglucosamine 2-epimerase [Tepidisphaeraceae bacterium]